MKPKTQPATRAKTLRKLAEQRLRESNPPAPASLSHADILRTVHDLQVHQVELEIQNEELLSARIETEASLERYSDLYDFAPVGYATLDPQGTLLEINRAAAKLLGVEGSRLRRRCLADSVAPQHRSVLGAYLSRVFGSDRSESCELSLVREGAPDVQLRIEGVQVASGRECRVVFHDITEHNRAEEDRRVLNKLESAGLLAGGIAHDFNNLLTVILFNLELAHPLGPDGEWAPLLEDAQRAALAARVLTQQLMTFAKRGPTVRKPISLLHVIKDSTRTALSGSGMHCEPTVASDLGSVDADEGQIAQVIRNLVLNAREASPSGGSVKVGAENIHLAASNPAHLPPGDFVCITIRDQGCGIDREVLPRIFDPYFSTKQRGDQKGMGLGLTICHTVVQNHGGGIRVETEAGRGTTFHVYLPHSSAKPESKTTSHAVAAANPRQGRLLVVESEPGMRRVLEMSISRMGHDVDLIPSNQQVLEHYAESMRQGRPYDAVLITLPHQGGPAGAETAQALLQLDPKAKVVALSANPRHPAASDPKRHGIAEFVEKPFELEKLRTVLVRMLEPEPASQRLP